MEAPYLSVCCAGICMCKHVGPSCSGDKTPFLYNQKPPFQNTRVLPVAGQQTFALAVAIITGP